jgi:hypothetical protein
MLDIFEVLTAGFLKIQQLQVERRCKASDANKVESIPNYANTTREEGV